MLDIKTKPLPHFNDRPQTFAIDTLVVHSMYAKDHADPTSLEACRTVLDACQVSAHYLIARSGEVWKLIDEDKRAWHAGVSKMPFSDDDRENVNHFSIGIELLATETSGFTPEQYESLTRLTLDLLSRHAITSIVGHENIAPGRKTDPGPFFDWPRYRAALQSATEKAGQIKFPA